MGITRRLYYDDAYIREFTPHLIDRSSDGLRLYFDETACYPTSGGQPHDLGTVAGVPLIGVEEEGERIAHLVAEPVPEIRPSVVVDWARRFDHMQQHTGQHLLSAVLAEQFGIATVSFHLGAESSTIDLNIAELRPELVRQVEERCQEVIYENRPVRVIYEDVAVAEGLRKASEREGVLRIITIDRLDRSACGGTHVRTTGEIGVLLLRKVEKIRGIVRLEFLCGTRAARQARDDYDAIAQVARVFSSTLDDVPKLVERQHKSFQDLAKAHQKLAGELADYQARELYLQTPPNNQGLRVVVRETPGELTDTLRRLAQSFTSQPRSVWLQSAGETRAILLAASEDSGLHAGNLLKDALKAVQGRGGGSARSAQGTVPGATALAQVLSALRQHL